jgi:anhydro-N-acetylmuramic acid kinase
MRVAGLMSGTSLDGLSIGAISIDDPKSFSTGDLKRVVRDAKFLGGKTFAFPKKLHDELASNAAVESRLSTGSIARVNSDFGLFCAKCVGKFLRQMGRLDLIGFHGQTVYHEPGSPTVTFQLGDPSPICLASNCAVVSDFRTMDTAACGQGAPIVSMVDYLRYSDPQKTRVVLNLGGIANLTYIPRGARLGDVRAFDVGPANMLIDGMVRELYGIAKDVDGKIASTGKASEDLMEYILKRDDFRSRPIPKSTGRERYSQSFLQKILDRGRELDLPREDIVATVSNYCLFMVDYHLEKLAKDEKRPIDEIIVGGGGSKNKFLMAGIRRMDRRRAVSTHADYGVPASFWESFSFAVLAFLAYHRVAGNVTAATGASKPVLLGRINYPATHHVI